MKPRLMMIVPTTKRVPVAVKSFRWCGALQHPDVPYRCSACRELIGTTRFGIAMAEGFSMRLCESCGNLAEQDVNEHTPQNSTH
jgi:hypothetical protein